MSTPVVDQPAPVPERTDLPAVWPLVVADVEWTFSEAKQVRDVVADMRERDAVGRARYSTPLQPRNGRDALVDAYQEQLDGAVYLRQALWEMEHDEPGSASEREVRELYRRTLDTLLRLRRVLDRREGGRR